MKTCLKCKKKIPNRYWEAHQRFHTANPVMSKSVQRRLSAQIGDERASKVILKPRSIGFSSEIAKEWIEKEKERDVGSR